MESYNYGKSKATGTLIRPILEIDCDGQRSDFPSSDKKGRFSATNRQSVLPGPLCVEIDIMPLGSVQLWIFLPQLPPEMSTCLCRLSMGDVNVKFVAPLLHPGGYSQ